ncbi:VPLPA-CTERM sorting domain-containing protein [Hyphococcus formosus]|uniref:VPLPA-CTERM sorting domain-containing protein n=1 Tax=Hyphococcus formosus TaxID=3143534 RepID=UPI00398B7245
MKVIIAGLVAAVFAISNANAALLWSYEAESDVTSPTGSNDGGIFVGAGIAPDTSFSDLFAGTAPVVGADTLITSNNVNTITSGADFDAFATSITDGVDHSFFFSVYLNNGGTPALVNFLWGPESELVASGVTASTNGIDLEGFVISSIVLTVTNVIAPASADGFNISADLRIDVYGDPVSDVPLPAAFPLFLAGLAGIGAMRRRQIKATR